MSYTVEQAAQLADDWRCAIDLIVSREKSEEHPFGVRLRPYGKDSPQKKMIWGIGATVEEAFNDAISEAQAQRLRALDYAWRPWESVRIAVDIPF